MNMMKMKIEKRKEKKKEKKVRKSKEIWEMKKIGKY